MSGMRVGIAPLADHALVIGACAVLLVAGVAGGGQSFRGDGGKSGFLTKPAGNSVNLEDQMLKVSANQMDYAAATSLYTRSLGLLKTAIGKR